MTRATDIRKQIRGLVAELYREEHAPLPFEPGKSRIPYAGRVFDEREMQNLVDSALEFWLTHGRYSSLFEGGLSALLGLPHAYLVNSGSSANLLAFMALTSDRLGERKVRRGDEIITVAAGFPTTIAPIVQFGAVPVFVDVSLPTCNIDCDRLEEALSPRTRGVMVAHTLGNPFDLDRVTAFCRKHGLWLVEDNCDALGSLYRGRLTGTFGDLGTSSFYPPHHITMGEGGAVYTANQDLAHILLSLRDWGRDCVCPSGVDDSCGRRFSRKFGELPFGYDHKFVYSHFGYNLKATDMQAAVGCAQLEKLADFVSRRRENWSTLHREFRVMEHLFTLPQATPGSEPSWFGFFLLVREEAPFTRNELVAHLERNRVQTRALFAGNLTRHPCFDGMRRRGEGYRIAGALANTDRIMERGLWVGVYPGLGEEKISYLVDTVRSFVKER